MNYFSKTLSAATLGIIFFTGCEKNQTENLISDKASNKTTAEVSADLTIYKRIYGATSVYQEGNYVVIKSSDLPDHKSPYYLNTQWSSTKYQAYNGTGTFIQNNNKIVTQNLIFKIPLYPASASRKTATPMGPIGVSLNGVPFYNQYAAGGVALTSEINSFDQYAGHPSGTGQYHYHIEPVYLTAMKGKSALLGFLLDGFPVYGPTENNVTVTNSKLDAYHGHTSATADYPNGIYHYHITSTDPYINGNGFYGTPGTVSN